MTGRTMALTEWQYEELMLYVDGEPRAENSVNHNLVRRGFLDRMTDGKGPGRYRLTHPGRLAIVEYQDAAR